MSLGILVFLTGCQNDNDELGIISQQSKVVITATMDSDTDTRTVLGGDDGKKVFWQNEDKLSVFLGNTRNQKFGIMTGAGTNYAEFQGEEGLIISGGTSDGTDAMTNVGYYPYSKDITVTQGESGSYTLNVTLPAVQQFVNASFGQEAWPMMAVTESKNDINFAFKTVATSWKIPMKGTAKIVKAYVKSVANGLAGAATVTASNTVLPELEMAEDATSTITLNCGDGVQLSASEAITFVFVIPPGTYATGDLTATFVDNQGKCMTVTTAKEYTIERNEPLNFNERTYTATDDAPTELELLQAAITAKEVSYTLTDNITVGTDDEKIVIPEGQTFTLDLNGKTITGSSLDFLDNKGTLNISNGKVSTDATITDGSNRRCIYNRAGATMTIDGVEFIQTCESWGGAINNAGTMVIEDATVDSKYWSIWNETTTGNLTIKGGIYNCNSYTESDEKDSGALNDNPTFSYMIKNTSGASLIIDGGIFNCTHGFAILEGDSKTIINGGEINHVCQQVITSHTFMIAGSETALTVNDCKVNWANQYNSGGTLVYLLESANAANISIVGGLYNLTSVNNESETSLTVTFVESGDATYPYKAIDPGYKAVTDGYEIYNSNGLAYAASNLFENGGTFNITDDIDMTGVEYPEVKITNQAGTILINGNGKTISNMSNQLISYTGSATSVKVQNLTLNGTKFNITDTGSNGVAAFIGYAGTSTEITLEECHVVNAEIEGGHWIGGFVGYAAGYNGRPVGQDGPVFETLTIKDCSVKNSSIVGHDTSCGAIIGHATGDVATLVKIENATVTGNTITTDDDNKAGSILGTVGAAGEQAWNGNFGGTYVINATVSNNTVTANNVTNNKIYGRQGSETGVLYVDGVQVVFNATQMATALKQDVATINLVLDGDIDLPITSLGSQTGGSGEYKLGGENTTAITIDLGGNKLNITTGYWSAIGANNADATFTVKNGTMTSTGNSAGTWNAYDVRLSNCNYVIEDVVFDKAVALDNVGKTAMLKNVTIKETHDYYALWITAEGQNVTIEGGNIVSSGRGIKIDEEYVGEDSKAKVTLNVSGTSFETAKKAAIMVKSTVGADIILSNVDITKVKADQTNAVWVDEDAASFANLVTVTGGTKITEGSN